MATSLQKRSLDRLLRGLGHDHQLAEQPLLDTSRVVLTSNVDSLAYAHAAAAVGRLWLSITPSILAAQFSALEFTPDEGIWIRELAIVSGNVNMNLSYGGGPSGAYTVNDALAGSSALCGRPEDTDFVGFTQATLANLVGGTATVPKVFRDAQVGRVAAGVGGMFTTTGLVWRDLWVPPGATFSVTAVVANTSFSAYFNIDLSAENFYT